VRNGCRSNAVLSPVLCGPPAEDETALGFGVFAMRELKPGVEIILGWEWDDGNAVRRSTCVVDDPIHVTVSFSYFYILFYLALTTFWRISFSSISVFCSFYAGSVKFAFTSKCTPPPKPSPKFQLQPNLNLKPVLKSPSLHEVQHLRNRMSNILHALSSTFATCACGGVRGIARTIPLCIRTRAAAS
jgi:hypothetical protein